MSYTYHKVINVHIKEKSTLHNTFAEKTKKKYFDRKILSDSSVRVTADKIMANCTKDKVKINLREHCIYFERYAWQTVAP